MDALSFITGFAVVSMTALGFCVVFFLSSRCCERCHKIGKNRDDYGYAGMTYCRRCAKKEGY